MAPILPVVMGLAQVAPMIARWLGGENAGQVAEKVVGIAKAVTGAATPEEALAKIQADSKAALDFQLAVMANEKDLDALYLADRQDARKRDTAITQAIGHNIRADILAFLAVGGLVICVWFVARDSELPERAVNAIMFVAGVLAAAVRDVYSFEFGSSRGSKEKDALLAKRD